MHSIQSYQKGARNWMEALEMKSGFGGMTFPYKDKKLPLYPQILQNLGRRMEGTSLLTPEKVYGQAAADFRDLDKNGGGVYPLYQGLELKPVEAAGKTVRLTNGTEVPFLPSFSVAGKLLNFNQKPDSKFVDLEIGLKGGKTIVVSVLPVDTHGPGSVVVDSVSVWHDDHDLPPKGEIFSTEPVRARYGATRLNIFDKTAGLSDNFLEMKNLIRLTGKHVLAGYQIGDDYARCDTSIESGGYSHPLAWYTPDGTPFLDAVYTVDTPLK